MNRRDFTRLAAAALGGVMAGAKLAAAEDKKEEKPKPKDKEKPLLLQEPHVCRGLNSCKEKGKGGKNDCAGQGACFTAAKHDCGGDNECAGLGGCGGRGAAGVTDRCGRGAVGRRCPGVGRRGGVHLGQAPSGLGRREPTFGDLGEQGAQ